MPVPSPRAALGVRLTVDRTHLLKKIIIPEAGARANLLCASTLQCQAWCPACFGYNLYFVWQQQQGDFHSALSHLLPSEV